MPDAAPKKIGGEYGEIRATIDIASLNAYLLTAPAIQTPVSIKQFKVCCSANSNRIPTEWNLSLGRYGPTSPIDQSER